MYRFYFLFTSHRNVVQHDAVTKNLFKIYIRSVTYENLSFNVQKNNFHLSFLNKKEE